MGNYNNIIITISGDPVSGKGTISRELAQLYKNQGYKVHIVSMGDLFRKVAIREYKKKFPEIENPSIEQIQKDPNFSEELKNIDEKIDLEMLPELGKEINSENRPKEVYIIDSRTAPFFIGQPHLAVRATVDSQTAGERVFNDANRGKEDQYVSIGAAIEATASRRGEEIKRFKEQYGKDITNLDHFDMVIETTLTNPKEIAETIKRCEELKRNGLKFAKTWASPELFFPTQRIQDTFSNDAFTAGLTPKQLSESIKEQGIYPDRPIASKRVANTSYQFVVDGHHRIVASIMAGKTLIPYEAKETLDKLAVSSRNDLSKIYDHEEAIIRPNGERFRYKTYPIIDERVQGLDICY